MNDKTQKKKFPWLPVIALSMGDSAIYAAPYIMYVLYDAMLEAFECTNAQLGALMTYCVIAATIATPIGSAFFVDRFQPRKLVAYSCIAQAPIVFISAAFPAVYPLQIACYCGLGVTSGFVIYSAILKGIRVAVPEEQQNFAYGVYDATSGTLAGIINIIAVAMFGKFVNQVLGFKVAYMFMGVVSLVGGILILFMVKDNKIVDNTTDGKSEESKGYSLKEVAQLFKQPGIWLCFFMIMGCYTVSRTSSYLTPYYTNVLGITVVESGFLAVFRQHFMRLLGSPFSGKVADKLGTTGVTVGTCLIVNVIIIGAIALLSPKMPHVVLIATILSFINAIVLTFAMGPMWAGMNEAHIPVHMSGIALALIGSAPTINDAIIPLFAGKIMDKYADNLEVGYHRFFIVVLTVVVLCSLCAFGLHKYDKKIKSREAASIEL